MCMKKKHDSWSLCRGTDGNLYSVGNWVWVYEVPSTSKGRCEDIRPEALITGVENNPKVMCEHVLHENITALCAYIKDNYQEGKTTVLGFMKEFGISRRWCHYVLGALQVKMMVPPRPAVIELQVEIISRAFMEMTHKPDAILDLIKEVV
eukprot:PhF_6_TR10537/c0_g1_i2/m.16643